MLTAERNKQACTDSLKSIKTFLKVHSPAFDLSMLFFRPGINNSLEECNSESYLVGCGCIKNPEKIKISCMLQQVPMTQHLCATQ